VAEPSQNEIETERRLAEERPAPSPSFRGRMTRLIERRRRWLPSDQTQSRLAFACAATGAMLALLAVVSVAGIGPLAT